MSSVLFILDSLVKSCDNQDANDVICILMRFRCVCRLWKDSVEEFLFYWKRGTRLMERSKLLEPFGIDYLKCTTYDNPLQRWMSSKDQKCVEGCLFAVNYRNTGENRINYQRNVKSRRCVHDILWLDILFQDLWYNICLQKMSHGSAPLLFFKCKDELEMLLEIINRMAYRYKLQSSSVNRVHSASLYLLRVMNNYRL